MVSGCATSLFQASHPASDDGIVVFEHAVGEPIGAQVLPDIFHPGSVPERAMAAG